MIDIVILGIICLLILCAFLSIRSTKINNAYKLRAEIKPNKPSHQAELEREILQYAEQGYTLRKIAETVGGLNHSKVYRIIKKYKK